MIPLIHKPQVLLCPGPPRRLLPEYDPPHPQTPRIVVSWSPYVAGYPNIPPPPRLKPLVLIFTIPLRH